MIQSQFIVYGVCMNLCPYKTKSPEIALSEENEQAFLKAIKEKPQTYLQMLANIDANTAECFMKDDYNHVFEVINTLPEKAFTANQMVASKFARGWLVSYFKI